MTPRELALMADAKREDSDEWWLRFGSLAVWIRPVVWGTEEIGVYELVPWLKPQSAEEREHERQRDLWEQAFSWVDAAEGSGH